MGIYTYLIIVKSQISTVHQLSLKLNFNLKCYLGNSPFTCEINKDAVEVIHQFLK
jgi:hypothetical protein